MAECCKHWSATNTLHRLVAADSSSLASDVNIMFFHLPAVPPSAAARSEFLLLTVDTVVMATL